MLAIDLVTGETNDIDLVRELFREYARSLDVDLSFQKFDEELASLPAPYAAIFIARWNDRDVVGCAALRAIDETTSEMKRLYVRDAFRGLKAGRALALRVIDEAKRRGFTRVRLDTLPSMTVALRMYQALGFVDIPAYRFNPIEGTRYLELDLAA